MSRQDAERRFRPHLLPLRRQRRLHRRPLRPLRARPGRGRRRVAELLREPEGRAGRRRARARRAPSWAKPNWPLQPNGDLVVGARRQLGRDRKDDRRQDQGARRRRSGVEHLRRRRAAGDARFDPRADADPRLPHARPSATPISIRSASSRRAARGRARSEDLRLHRSRSRPHDLPRQGARPRIRARCARSSPSCAAPIARRIGFEFMHISEPGAEGLDPGAHRGRATRRSPSPAKASARSSTS